MNSFTDLEKVLIKAHLMSMGYSNDELKRPLIAVVNSHNEINQGHGHLNTISAAVKRGILEAGGFPLEFNTIALCDGITGWYSGKGGVNYTYPSRDLICDSIETMILGQPIFSGMVCIATCDKIVPAMLQAMARINLPSVFISGGPCHPLKGNVTTEDSQKSGWARKAYLKGEIEENELLRIIGSVYNTSGSCPIMGTANTMCILGEALGMSVSGSSTIPALSAFQQQNAVTAGHKVMELVNNNITPSKIMTQSAFENAIKIMMAIGGSTNCVLHIPAIAKELGIDIDFKDFARISDSSRFICSVLPNGDADIVDLHLEGGVPLVMKKIEPILDTSVLTINGGTLKDIIDKIIPKKSEIVWDMDDPRSTEGGITVLYGNIAPEGAIVKQSAVSESMRKFTGRAVVFNGLKDFTDNLYSQRIIPGSVIVINYVGEIGAPGYPEIPVHLLDPLVGMDIAVITDGRFSGTFYGLLIGYVMPEAAKGGSIGIIHEGDEIQIDLDSKTIHLNVDEETLSKRENKIPNRELKGYLLRYTNEKSKN